MINAPPEGLTGFGVAMIAGAAVCVAVAVVFVKMLLDDKDWFSNKQRPRGTPPDVRG